MNNIEKIKAGFVLNKYSKKNFKKLEQDLRQEYEKIYSSPRIVCAKCRKVVDKIESQKCMKSCHTFYTVYCHGEKETTCLSDLDMLNLKSIEGGIAFRNKNVITATEVNIITGR